MNIEKYINKVDNFLESLRRSNNHQIINFEIIESLLEVFRTFALDKLKDGEELIVFTLRGKGLELLSAFKDIIGEDSEKFIDDMDVPFVAMIKKKIY